MTPIPPLAPTAEFQPSTPGAGASSRPEPPPAAPLPSGDAAPVEAAPRTDSPQALQEKLDRLLQAVQTSLRFRVDEDSGRVVVSVVDRSGEVLMQIPDETALRIARRLAETGKGLIEQRA